MRMKLNPVSKPMNWLLFQRWGVPPYWRPRMKPMIAATARAMPTRSNRKHRFFFQTDHRGFFAEAGEKMNTPAADEISNRQIDVATWSPSNALRKGRHRSRVPRTGARAYIHHQPNEAHQYRPLLFFFCLHAEGDHAEWSLPMCQRRLPRTLVH